MTINIIRFSFVNQLVYVALSKQITCCQTVQMYFTWVLMDYN